MQKILRDHPDLELPRDAVAAAIGSVEGEGGLARRGEFLWPAGLAMLLSLWLAWRELA